MLLHSLCCFFARHSCTPGGRKQQQKSSLKKPRFGAKAPPTCSPTGFSCFFRGFGDGCLRFFSIRFCDLTGFSFGFSDHLPQSAGSSRTPCRKKRRHQQDRRRNRDNISYSALLWAVFGIHAGFHDPLGDGTIIPQRLFRVIGANPAI